MNELFDRLSVYPSKPTQHGDDFDLNRNSTQSSPKGERAGSDDNLELSWTRSASSTEE